MVDRARGKIHLAYLPLQGAMTPNHVSKKIPTKTAPAASKMTAKRRYLKARLGSFVRTEGEASNKPWCINHGYNFKWR